MLTDEMIVVYQKNPVFCDCLVFFGESGLPPAHIQVNDNESSEQLKSMMISLIQYIKKGHSGEENCTGEDDE
jgi:hypothetical protein